MLIDLPKSMQNERCSNGDAVGGMTRFMFMECDPPAWQIVIERSRGRGLDGPARPLRSPLG